MTPVPFGGRLGPDRLAGLPRTRRPSISPEVARTRCHHLSTGRTCNKCVPVRARVVATPASRLTRLTVDVAIVSGPDGSDICACFFTMERCDFLCDIDSLVCRQRTPSRLLRVSCRGSPFGRYEAAIHFKGYPLRLRPPTSADTQANAEKRRRDQDDGKRSHERGYSLLTGLRHPSKPLL